MRLLDRIFKRENRTSTDFEPGQVWSYKTRAEEVSSHLLVGAVVNSHKGRVICVLVSGLSIRNGEGETLSEISHLPISDRALRSSVTRLRTRQQEIPASFNDGFRQWRKMFALNKAGFYDVPVTDCVAIAERSFQSTDRPLV